MLNWLSSYLVGLGAKTAITRPWIFKLFSYLTSLSLIGKVYEYFYLKKIHKTLSYYESLPGYQVALEPFNVCNIECTMCPYPDMDREKTKMPMDLYKKIINEVVAFGHTRLNLTHYNEPFLDKNLFERILYAKKKGMTVGFFSNATVMNSEKAESALDAGVDWINFSIDGGTKESFEKIRIGANFEETCNNISYLIKLRKKRNSKKPTINIHTTIVSKENLESSKQLTELLNGADTYTMGLADSRADEGNYNFMKKFSSSNRNKSRLYPCSIPWTTLTIMSNGKVCLCCRDHEGEVILGDLNKQSIEEVLNSKEMHEIRDLHLKGDGDKIDLCKNCDSLYRANLNWWVG
jgi:radical SAM protein with 4Fe4S-binding SPASM domain